MTIERIISRLSESAAMPNTLKDGKEYFKLLKEWVRDSNPPAVVDKTNRRAAKLILRLQAEGIHELGHFRPATSEFEAVITLKAPPDCRYYVKVSLTRLNGANVKVGKRGSNDAMAEHWYSFTDEQFSLMVSCIDALFNNVDLDAVADAHRGYNMPGGRNWPTGD